MAENIKGEEGDGSLAGGGGKSSSSSSSTLIIPSVSIDIQAATTGNVQSGWRLGRQIHRVPTQLRLMQPTQKYVYEPETVSLGPYHHGKSHLRQLEEFKTVTLELILSGSDSGKDKDFFYNKIYEQIGEIRSCYVGMSANEYDDAALSEMMLRDASFIIYYMKANTGDMAIAMHMFQNLGILTGVLTSTDIHMLENQIPYWVIKFLMCSRFGEFEWEALLKKHLSDVCFGYVNRRTNIPWMEGEVDHQAEEPLHLLEATQRILVRPEQQINHVTTSTRIFRQISSWIFKISRHYMCSRPQKKKEKSAEFIILSHYLPSVTYLKTKGIHFRQSSSFIKDVRFKSNALYGKLLLPVRFVSKEEKVFFANLIAFELSPRVSLDYSVTSYINFMKRLIENPKDVKELRKQGILFGNLVSDEEVVKVFQEIDTRGIHIDSFDNVKMSIAEYCKNESKEWIPELINTYFRSPWTITALLAATILLILTFLQTFYTIRAA